MILLVDDDANAIRVMSHILADVGPLRFATNGIDALRLAREQVPEIILLDAEMPMMSGFRLIEALKAEPGLADVPVIFVTSHNDAAFEVSALETGAVDFISKPVTPELLRARVKTHLRAKRAADELRLTALTDGLTGLANRRQFDQYLEREWARARRFNDPLSLLLIDVDHFKMYNDRYGHPKGDVCLKRVATALRGVSRRAPDLVARCGGEEFAVLLPQTPRAGADHAAHRVLGAVEALKIPHDVSPTAPHVTVSVGVAYFDATSTWWVRNSADYRGRAGEAGDLVLTADKALYCAKEAGRAQVRVLDIGAGDKPKHDSVDDRQVDHVVG